MDQYTPKMNKNIGKPEWDIIEETQETKNQRVSNTKQAILLR